jgi:hypothetical protein
VLLRHWQQAHKLLEGGAVPVLKNLAAHPDERLQQYAALALAALSTYSGTEEWLMQDGALVSSTT